MFTPSKNKGNSTKAISSPPEATSSKKKGKSTKATLPLNAEKVSEGILAFRTITTILAEVQDGTTFSDSKAPTEQCRELEILNALSTVIVRDVEIVAVIVKD
jgi:hypothetical protein